MYVTDSLISDIRRQMPELRLLENEPMSAHCSFRIGGPARLFAEPSSEQEAAKLCGIVRSAGLEPFIMGNGTNLLISDAGLDAVVIHLGDGMSRIEQLDGERVHAGSGVPLARLAVSVLGFGLTGLEFAHGIPGSLGGAVYMNAGAYGGEMRDVLESVRYVDEAGRLIERGASELGLSYRSSMFSGGLYLITGATLKLIPGEPESIQARMRELSEKRRASQPLDKPSAGSTFKRPQGGYAGALIEAAGLKGFSIGGAQVSEKHAGFVVNAGNASFDDVTRLIEHIRQTVYNSSGITLEPEVKIIRG